MLFSLPISESSIPLHQCTSVHGMKSKCDCYKYYGQDIVPCCLTKSFTFLISVISGLCNIQQLVAHVISSYVCASAYALFILWRWINSVSYKPGWWRLDRCCKVPHWSISRWELSDSYHP